jgi:bifunctional DNA-binding transcriptional regulator/antitoxin component of YhaV-PrlF toxin-antitoxin module
MGEVLVPVDLPVLTRIGRSAIPIRATLRTLRMLQARRASLDSRDAVLPLCRMTATLPVSKRGTLTLPPGMRRKLGLDRLRSPMVLVEERDGGLFLQPAAALPVRDIPKETLARWIARDEAEMKEYEAAGKRKRK